MVEKLHGLGGHAASHERQPNSRRQAPQGTLGPFRFSTPGNWPCWTPLQRSVRVGARRYSSQFTGYEAAWSLPPSYNSLRIRGRRPFNGFPPTSPHFSQSTASTCLAGPTQFAALPHTGQPYRIPHVTPRIPSNAPAMPTGMKTHNPIVRSTDNLGIAVPTNAITAAALASWQA